MSVNNENFREAVDDFEAKPPALREHEDYSQGYISGGGDRDFPDLEGGDGQYPGSTNHAAPGRDFPGPEGGDRPPGFLDLVYGILFEPSRAMEKVARRPPVGYAVLIVTILSLTGAVMFFITLSGALSEGLHKAALDQFLPAVRALLPFAAFLALIWGYLKWFGYSAVLHLVSELTGGTGRASGVFAAAGLAGLPSIFMVPFQFLALRFGARSSAVEVLLGLAGLALAVWSFILLVIGVKKVHGFTTGRAVLVTLTPLIALAVSGLVLLGALVAFFAAMPARMRFPGYF